MKKNSMLKLSVPIVGIALVALSAKIFGAPEKEQTRETLADNATAKNNAISENATPKETLRDPFSDAPVGDALASDSAPAGISMKGIIIMESGAKLAVLRIPGYAHTLLVREGETVRAIPPETDGAANAITLSTDIVIRKINESEVEISPKNDPENITAVR